MTTYNIQLRTGQVALYVASGIIGRLIALVDRFPAALWMRTKSHGGLIIVDGGRHYVLDARKPYVDVRPISADVLHGYRIKIASAPEGVVWNEQGLIDFAYAVEGKAPYATWRMLSNIWTEVFGCPTGLPDHAKLPNNYHCTELVSWLCWLFARWADTGMPYDPLLTKPHHYTTPDDLDRRSSLVTLTDRLAIVEAAA